MGTVCSNANVVFPAAPLGTPSPTGMADMSARSGAGTVTLAPYVSFAAGVSWQGYSALAWMAWHCVNR